MLKLLLESVNLSFKNVFEFRHISWWNVTVLKQFSLRGLIFCGVSFPKLPDEVSKTSDDLYCRFHGVPILYKSVYENDFIAKIYMKI